MRSSLVALVSATLVLRAYSHNLQGILLVNGTGSKEWEYVRNVAGQWDEPTLPPEIEFHKTPPQYDIDSSNITCGRSAFSFASQTKTADVLAGSEVGFRVSYDASQPGQPRQFWHPGPGQIYLSRAPNDDIEHYSGEHGEWFKIAYAGPVNRQKWQLPGQSDFNFTIPQTTPPGKYLLRTEQFMPSNEFGGAQWYVNCAQVNIIGPGGGKPTGFAKFPGTYKLDDAGILVPVNQYDAGYVKPEELRLDRYTPPGPPVWTGA